MDEALDEIEFLALSANRIEVLRALADRPRTRGALSHSTDASQPTVGRVLRDFEERRWVMRTDEGYVATATGELVAAGIGDLLAIIETDRKLRPVMEWLPTATMDFDLRRLREASITMPSPTRPSAPLQRALSLLGEAFAVRICSHTFNEQSLSVIRERVDAGTQTFAGVFSRAAIDALAADATLRSDLCALVETADAQVRVHDAALPVALAVTDDQVHVMVRDESGVLRATIDTDDPEVLAWADGVHERYWEEATALRVEDL